MQWGAEPSYHSSCASELGERLQASHMHTGIPTHMAKEMGSVQYVDLFK